MLATILTILAVLVAAVGLCTILARATWFKRRYGGVIAAGALLAGLGHVYAGNQHDMVQTSKDETKRKKEAHSGDPEIPPGP